MIRPWMGRLLMTDSMSSGVRGEAAVGVVVVMNGVL
jgi:hypothetical protein